MKTNKKKTFDFQNPKINLLFNKVIASATSSTEPYI